MKIKKNDTVKVIAGADKGTTGTVTEVNPGEGTVVVSGVNVKKKHQRAQQKGESGEIREINAPIDISNVALVDPDSGEATRVGYQVDSSGTKKRVSKKSGKEI